MTVEEPKPRGRVAAAILAGSALTLSSFAVSVPAAFAQPSPSETTTSEPTESPTEATTERSTEELTETPTDDSTETPTGELTEDDPSETDSPDDPSETDSPDDPSETDSPDPSETGTPDDGEPNEPTLNVDRNEVAQGETLSVSGSGFTAGAELSLEATLQDTEENQTSITDTAQARGEEDDEPGSFSASLEVPADAAPGVYNLVVTEVDGDNTATESFTVSANDDDEDEVEEPELTVSPRQIWLSDFIGDPNEGDPDERDGVFFHLAGLEGGTDYDYAVEGPADVEGSDDDLKRVGADGTAGWWIAGPETDEPSIYLGDYSVTVTYEDEAGETQTLGPVEFTVVEDATPVVGKPEINLTNNQVAPGGSLYIEVSNLSPEGDVTVEWNPTEVMTADTDGNLTAELPIAADTEPGDYQLIVTDEESGESSTADYTVLSIEDPALSIDPETITLDEFIGDPEDGAGVTHVVENLEPGSEVTTVVTGPEGVNDYEDTEFVDDEGRVEFVIYGFDVANPEVYLGEYNSVVTYINEDGNAVELTGDFTVISGADDTAADATDDADTAAPAGGAPADLNGTSLADTGASGAQLGLLAGALLLAGGAFLAYANRGRLFSRKH